MKMNIKKVILVFIFTLEFLVIFIIHHINNTIKAILSGKTIKGVLKKNTIPKAKKTEIDMSGDTCLLVVVICLIF